LSKQKFNSSAALCILLRKLIKKCGCVEKGVIKIPGYAVAAAGSIMMLTCWAVISGRERALDLDTMMKSLYLPRELRI
jgi:hypothetical protein